MYKRAVEVSVVERPSVRPKGDRYGNFINSKMFARLIGYINQNIVKGLYISAISRA